MTKAHHSLTKQVQTSKRRVRNDREMIDRFASESPMEKFTERVVTVQTWLNPSKGWTYQLVYRGRVVARGRHHLPLEPQALRNAMHALRDHLVAEVLGDADPEVLIRLDKWEADAMRRCAEAGVNSPQAVREPARLECGHIRMVKPNARLGGQDQVNCGKCGTHRGIAEFLENGP